MNWVVASWNIIGGMGLALGFVQLIVWVQRREAREHLIYALFALTSALGSFAELRMMMAQTPEAFSDGLRLSHLTFGIAVLCMPWFARVRFRAGRNWLLYLVTGLRLAVILATLLLAITVNFANIELRHVVLPGGVVVAAPVGSFNPWVLVAHLNLVLMLVYFFDVLVELRRRADPEEYRRALWICGSMIAFILIAGGHSALVVYGVLTLPFINTPVFLLPILVLGFELGADVLRAQSATQRLGLSESRLRESEARWELAGQIAGIAPWTWHAPTDELVLSPKAREMFGVSVEGMARIGDWIARIHPEDAERVRRDVQQTIADADSFERNYRMLMPDGRVRWIGSRGRVERGPDGTVVSMHGVSFDLTEMRQADAMFRAALEAAPNAIFLLDGAGSIQLANARASRLFGYGNEELQQMPFGLLVPNWVHQPERRRRNVGGPGGVERRSRVRETHALRRGGSEPMPVELELRPLEGGLTVASVTDITERRASEQESALQRTELAHLSRVAVLGEMSSSLAHELNQPLTAIVSNAQAALRFLDGGPEQRAELHETLRDIAASGSRAGDVIRRLRAMLKKEEAQRSPLDVNQLISEVLQLYRSDLINRGVSVRLELDQGLPAVLGDRVQLQQVLLNLVINACDAMSALPGERRLCVCSRRLPGNEVEFAVCDAGPGIAPDRLEQVFEPFVTSKSTGMGLGLSVCKTIVKSHGGRIWAANNHEKPGASFHVALTAMSEVHVPPRAAELDRS